MKIKYQFFLVMILFGLVLIIIASSVIITNQQVIGLNEQEEISSSIENRADVLIHLSNSYFLYQENETLILWQSNISSLSSDLSKLNPDTPERTALYDKLKNDAHNLNTAFMSLVTFLQNAPRNVSVRVIPEFQNNWSELNEAHKDLARDAYLLAQSLSNQGDQLRQWNILLIFALLFLFGAFFFAIYIITYRRTLTSISELQAGINIIGLGNLDHRIENSKNDEIGDLSRSINTMAISLKSVTTSKTELEKEVEKRKTAEIALRASEQRWATTLASIGDAVIATDKQGNIVFMNKTAENLTGWTLNEVLQKHIKEAFNIINEETRSEVENPVTKVLEKGLIVGLANHTVLIRKDKTEIPIDDSGAPIKTAENEVTGVVLIFRDITERRWMESKIEEYGKHLENLVEERTAQLRDAERLAAIGATAGMVGHDIRNPLQTIAGEIYLAKSDIKDLPEGEAKQSLKESLKVIDEQIVYVNKIISDLQDYAKPLKPNIENVNLKDIIQSVFTTTKFPENVSASYLLSKDFPTLEVDSSYMQRILANLTLNAIQAMPKGGKLTIKAVKENTKAIVTVEDTGEGIPEEARSKLFLPLMTTKAKGQGFGLAVVKRLIEALGGNVAFESEVGKGTKFTITLPFQRTDENK